MPSINYKSNFNDLVFSAEWQNLIGPFSKILDPREFWIENGFLSWIIFGSKKFSDKKIRPEKICVWKKMLVQKIMVKIFGATVLDHVS